MVGQWPPGRPSLGHTITYVMKLHGNKTLAFAQTRLSTRADASASADKRASTRTQVRPPGRSKKNIKKSSVFGFQSPRSPSSAGEATRRIRFFRPSSPSHPSKLYSSLGWLNSKVPKPFFPFTPRLIDVDGF
jgi:hypothetical protein